MSKIPESSKVTLYSGVDITSGLQIAFKSKAGQNAYFTKKIYSTAVSNKNFYYIRRTGKIKLEISANDASKCDYMSFINPAFENKIFYAKITNYEYVSNKVTEISYAIDYFQTYMFDVTYEEGVIEREHLSEDGYQKSVEYPFRRDVYELNTAENFNISKEMEEIYDLGELNDMSSITSETKMAIFPDEYNLSDRNRSTIVVQISDFDTSEMTDIETNFYEKFDMIINSRGVVTRDIYDGVIPDRPKAVPIHIGRGYGLYAIFGTKDADLKKFSDAINWLTFHGLDGQIINAFQIAEAAWNAYVFHSEKYGSYTAEISPNIYNVHNKKLLRFPYQYIRVSNNEGDFAEYKFEMFSKKVIKDGNTVPICDFMYVAMMDGVPSVSIVPVDYRRNGLNPDERMDCRQIPQIGYTTDSYLAFLASQYNMNIAGRTDSLSEDVNSMIDKRASNTSKENGMEGAAGTDFISSARNQLVSAGNALGNLLSGNVQGAVQNVGNISAYSVREEASLWKSGGNYVWSGYFAPAEAAFVADKYNPGSTNGTLGYFMRLSTSEGFSENRFYPGSFTFTRVKLLDEVLSVFDTYMNGYGNTSGRYGKPRICSYIKGETDNIPHFAPYFGHNVTYVKTNNMHVIHTISDVSKNIEDMFNTGIQFMKGEDL